MPPLNFVHTHIHIAIGQARITATIYPMGIDSSTVVILCRGETPTNAHAGSRTRVTSMGALYDAATLHARPKDNNQER